MLIMVCRNRVVDFAAWRGVFESHASAHRAAGMQLRTLARELAEPNNVFFTFEIETVERAKAFIDAPNAADAGAASGVIDGEYHFVETVA